MMESPATSDTHTHVPRADRWVADACLLFTTVIWGLNIPIFKQSIQLVDPWVFNALRLVLAAITLAICVVLESRQQLLRPTKRVLTFRVILFGFLSGFLYQIVFVSGIERTTAGNGGLLLASMPMWTALFSMLFLGERLPRVTWIGLAMTFVGTLVVILQRSDLSAKSEHMVGNFLMLSAALTWASATVLSRKVLSDLSPLRLALWTAILTTPLHLLVSLPHWSGTWDRLKDPTIWGYLAFSGILSTGLAYATWHVGVRRLGASHAAVYQNIVTLVAVVGGVMFLGERLTVGQLIGGFVMIAGLFTMRRGRAGTTKS
jgi:drug/metabolite transporter (DMT)-like permease